MSNQPEAASTEALAELWLEAKTNEENYRKLRIQAELDIIANIGAKLEGTETTTVDHYKIITTGRLTRRVDWDKFDDEVAPNMPKQLMPVKTKRELDAAGLKWLQNNEPDYYRLMARCLETKPGKTGMKIERIEGK